MFHLLVTPESLRKAEELLQHPLCVLSRTASCELVHEHRPHSDQAVAAGQKAPASSVRRSLHQFVPWGLPRPDEAVRRYVSRQAEHLSSRLLPELGTHLGIEARPVVTLTLTPTSTLTTTLTLTTSVSCCDPSLPGGDTHSQVLARPDATAWSAILSLGAGSLWRA